VSVAAAQATGTISGLVTDATEAALPAAMVEVTSRANGLVRRSTTAPDGVYVIPLLPPGIYQVHDPGYVGSAAAPALDVSKLGTLDAGEIGLWVGNNSDGDFANLRITPMK
jgi:hypothetical protein